MANFSKLVITEKGKELLNHKLSSEKTMTYTKIALSSHEYAQDELKGLEQLADIRQIEAIRKTAKENHDTVVVDAVFDNNSLLEGYLVKAAGLYARLEGQEEILFAIAVELSNASYIPEHTETMTAVQLKLRIKLENAENVNIFADTAGAATIGDVLDVRTSLEEHESNAGVHVSADEKREWNESLDSAKEYSNEIYQQATGYTDQKIADLIGGAPETLDTLKEVADAIEENEDVVSALNAAIGNKANQEELEKLEKSVLEITPENIGALSTPTSLKGSLDDCKNPGFYYAVGGNKITEKPQGVDAFGLLVTREGNINRGQLLMSSQRNIGIYTRKWTEALGAWSDWVQIFDSDWNVTSATKATYDENGYRITGYLKHDGDASDITVNFTSADSEEPSEWTDVALLKNTNKFWGIFNRISIMFRNVRYLYKMLGTTDISQVGNGTVTGALSSLSANSLKCKVVSSPVTGIAAGSYKEIQFDTGLSGDHTLMAAVPVLNQHSYLQTEAKLISATVYSVKFRFNNNGNAAITSGALSAVLLYT